MVGPPPDMDDDTGAGGERESATSTPRWVKVFGIIALVVVLLFVILLLTGGHGPSRHTESGDAVSHTASGVTEHGLQQA
jgi:ABC-type transporter Mla subunit MlaD